jgi:hypothetical protein
LIRFSLVRSHGGGTRGNFYICRVFAEAFCLFIDNNIQAPECSKFSPESTVGDHRGDLLIPNQMILLRFPNRNLQHYDCGHESGHPIFCSLH